MHFLRRVWYAFQTGVVSTMHVQVCTLDRCCEQQRTHLLTRLLQDVHMPSVIVKIAFIITHKDLIDDCFCYL